MSKSLPQILPTDRPFWFCLRAQTKREHFAAIGLRKQYQITCFAPRLRMRKLTKRGAVWFVEAMFPGYFFAQFDYVTERRRVEHAPASAVFFSSEIDWRQLIQRPLTLCGKGCKPKSWSRSIQKSRSARKCKLRMARCKGWKFSSRSCCPLRNASACYWNFWGAPCKWKCPGKL